MKIYALECDFDNFSHFYDNNSYENGFAKQSYFWHESVNHNIIYKYRMNRNNKGLKNFKLDISVDVNHLILSDKAVAVLKDILDKSGTFFEIETGSKRKKFTGFFPNKCILPRSIIDYKTPGYKAVKKNKDNENKTIENITSDMFVIDGVSFFILVSEKMKTLIEESGLGGVKFDVYYDSEIPRDWKFQIIKSHLDDSEWGEVIRKAYNYYGKAENFDDIIIEKDNAEELPFIPFYEQDKELIMEERLNPTRGLALTKQQMSFLQNKEIREERDVLRRFYQFLSTFKINVDLKTDYMSLFSNIEVFKDGTMVDGHFFKGIFPSET